MASTIVLQLALLAFCATLMLHCKEEDANVLEQMDTFSTIYLQPIKAVNGSQRLSVLSDKTYTVGLLELFQFIGNFMRNGSIGYCEDDFWYCYVYMDRKQDLRKRVLSMFEGMKGLKKGLAYGFHYVFGTYRRPYSSIDDTLKLAFETTWKVLDDLNNDKLAIHYNFTHGHPVINATLELSVPLDCADFFSLSHYSDYSEDRDALKVLLNLVGPECEKPLANEPSDWDFESGKPIFPKPLAAWERLRRLCEEVANITGFAGGNSNRCLHKFLIHYMDYSIVAYDTFLDYLGIYLFQHISMYGICSSISLNATMQKVVSENALDALGTIVAGLLKARNTTMNEERPTTTTASTTTAVFNTTPWAATKTSTEIDTKILLTLMEQAKDFALALHGINGPKAWSERPVEHEKIAAAVYSNLTTECKPEVHGVVSFEVLVYLPFAADQTEMHCLPNKTATNIQGINEKGVDYFIQFHRREQGNISNSVWQAVKGREAHIVDAVFSSISKNLCAKSRDAITSAVSNALDGHAGAGFSAFAAVRCGYKFVWYQLAYNYFTVGRMAGSNYTLTSRNDNSYNGDCGQIFLFP